MEKWAPPWFSLHVGSELYQDPPPILLHRHTLDLLHTPIQADITLLLALRQAAGTHGSSSAPNTLHGTSGVTTRGFFLNLNLAI